MIALALLRATARSLHSANEHLCEQMRELKNLYGKGVIKFVSKETMGADVGNLDKYTYATYHANRQKLEIHQAAVFERISQSSEYLSLFKILDDKNDTDFTSVPALKN